MNKRAKLILGGIFLSFFVLFLILQNPNAYSTGYTHPRLTRESVKFYNYFNNDNLLNKEKVEWLVKGSVDEDTPPRYINHFYDPINNTPWLEDSLVTLTAKDWANDSEAQSKYILGDQTFNAAVYQYREGNYKQAFVALGHVLHLIQDVTVPAHTRNDTHIPAFGIESPFESWVENHSKENYDEIFKRLIDKNKEISTCFSLDNCFDATANHSNKYFFSIDSIENYDFPKIIKYKLEESPTGDFKEYGYGLDEEGKEFRLIGRCNANWRNFSSFIKYDFDSKVLNDYWIRLSEKAVQSSARIMELFFDEIEYQEKNNIPNEKPLSWWDNFKNKIKTLFGLTPATTAKKEVVLSSGSNNRNEEINSDIVLMEESEDGDNLEESIEIDNIETKLKPKTIEKKIVKNSNENIEWKDYEFQTEELEVILDGVGGADKDAQEEIMEIIENNLSQNEERTNPIISAPQYKFVGIQDDNIENEDIEVVENATEEEEENEDDSTEDQDDLENTEEEPEEDIVEEDVIVEEFYQILISEVKLAGSATGQSKDEFVELYNPNNEDVLLSGWKIRPFTGSGNAKSYLLRPFPENAVISANSYYLIAHNEYLGDTTPDAFYSTGSSLADDNGLILYNQYNGEVDKVGWGELEANEIFESSATNSFERGSSIERKANSESTADSMSRCGEDEFLGNGFDSNNNFNDFVIRANSDPQNSSSLIEPREATSSEVCVIENVEENVEGGGEDGDLSGTVLTGVISNEVLTLTLESSPYLVSMELVIAETSSLVIEPGVIVKFGREYQSTWSRFPTNLRIQGSLYVNGTAENPVIFTSIGDDNFGGDSNNNGNATNPTARDWGAVIIESSADKEININNAHFYYGGESSGSVTNNAVLVSRGGVNVNVQNSYFSNNATAISNFGWRNNASKPINISNSLIENNISGIILDTYAPISISNSTIRNNSDYGIYLEAYSADVFNGENNNIYGNGKYGLWNFYGWGLKSKGLSIAEISAQNNWWGSADGPEPVGNGNRVRGEVDFSNWRAEPINN